MTLSERIRLYNLRTTQWMADAIKATTAPFDPIQELLLLTEAEMLAVAGMAILVEVHKLGYAIENLDPEHGVVRRDEDGRIVQFASLPEIQVAQA